MTDSPLPLFEFAQVLPLGLRFPARMSVLPLERGRLALVSPVPIDDDRAAAIAALGEVAFLIAPNLLHHLHLGAAAQRYPEARVLAPSGLRRKRPDLPIGGSLDQPLPAELRASVEVVPIGGAPKIDEYAFYHRETRTLVLTDLVFNITRPEGWLAHLVLWLGGCHGHLGSSRVWRLQLEDRVALRASVERLLELPFETLVMAHGSIVQSAARAQLQRALAWALPPRGAQPLASSSR
ncbi:MAG TPA: DUF4336 domain-containing protein [Polyangiaceae bacterium]|jgi:hypothetical protein|nr:DUF4336 domain-containing protein [Polyangiaceae bacterium]